MSSSSPDPQETTHKAKVISTVTHYTLVPGGLRRCQEQNKAEKRRKKPKPKILHTLSKPLSASTLDFLKLILENHGEERYNITVKMLYSMKVQLAGIKKTEALDADTLEEFKELVKDDIIAKKTLKLTIFVDMADIEKRWRKLTSVGQPLNNEVMNPSLWIPAPASGFNVWPRWWSACARSYIRV
ncbi:hypothetical protein B0H14DRAFT_2592049 [Mycena olivaceomarginata]|nr:hypothetical protein B0H14DRAFT_2592049 [Mycena olivaceomarginata]